MEAMTFVTSHFAMSGGWSCSPLHLTNSPVTSVVSVTSVALDLMSGTYFHLYPYVYNGTCCLSSRQKASHIWMLHIQSHPSCICRSRCTGDRLVFFVIMNHGEHVSIHQLYQHRQLVKTLQKITGSSDVHLCQGFVINVHFILSSVEIEMELLTCPLHSQGLLFKL